MTRELDVQSYSSAPLADTIDALLLGEHETVAIARFTRVDITTSASEYAIPSANRDVRGACDDVEHAPHESDTTTPKVIASEAAGSARLARSGDRRSGGTEERAGAKRPRGGEGR